MENIYKIEALDIADYNENELIDIYITSEELGQEEVLKEWAKENDKNWACFLAKRVSEEELLDERKSILSRISRLEEKKKMLNKRLSEIYK